MNFLFPAPTYSAIFAALTFIFTLWKLLRWLDDKIASSNDMEKIHEKLNQEMARLRAKMVDDNETLQSQRATKRPSSAYKNRIKRVGDIEDDVEAMNTQYKTERQKSKWFLFYARSSFSKTMEAKGQEIVTLLEERLKRGWFLADKEPERVVQQNAPDIKEFPTLQKALEKIVSYLGKYKCIGVWGKPGIGKTTILKNLNDHKEVATLFDLVIWVKVSEEKSNTNLITEEMHSNKNLSIEEMQHKIVERLNLPVIVNSHIEVASIIKEKLRGMKYLLLLDGVEEDVQLDEIGVDPNNENDGTIVLTTTDKLVCNSMVNRLVEVKELTETEGVNMFKNALEESTHKDNSNLQGLMLLAVKICDGHPLAIRTVARYFKMKETEQEWHDAFKNLGLWPKQGDRALQPLYKLLNFGSNQLEIAHKNCFFYSAIFPGESNIYTDCLLDCWAAEELYPRAETDDAQNMRVKGRKILDDLKSLWLLEECVRKKCVRMQKLIRQAALHKLSTENEPKYMVKTDGSLCLDAGQWEGKKYISWCHSEVPDQFSNDLIVSTLLLQENLTLGTIPRSLFYRTEALRVLNLYRTGITLLPPALSRLIYLKVLYLNGCTDLVELPSQIGELGDLEVLDIRDSGVEILPSQVDNLNRLRRLLVSFTNFGIQSDAHVKLYNCELISRILSLEEFIVEMKSFKVLCGVTINIVTNKVAPTLTRLRTLKFCFEDGAEVDVIKMVGDTPTFRVPKADDLTNFVQRINDLESFQVFIGCSISSPPEIPDFSLYRRYLRYCGGRGQRNFTINNVVANSDAIELVNHNNLQYVSELGTANGLVGRRIILPKLLRLYMRTLPQLKSIWKDQLQQESLPELMTLEIRKCYKIEELLPVEVGNWRILPKLTKLTLVDLRNLERICASWWLPPALGELQIEKCPKLKELPLNADNTMNLRILILVDLEILRRICLFGWRAPVLEEVQIRECHFLSELPLNAANSINLKKLILVGLHILVKICAFGWTAPALEELEIHGCPMLTALPFRADTAMRLQKLTLVDMLVLNSICIAGWTAPALEELEIRGCPMVTVLPLNTDEATRLRKLIVVDLLILVRICTFGWTAPALEELEIRGCPILTVLPFNTDEATRLRKLTLVDMEILNRICTFGWIATALEELEIRGCPMLTVLPFNTNNAMRLKKLTIVDMPILNSISAFGWRAPALEELVIHGCPRLTELPFNIDCAVRLRSIQAEQNWWKALHWHDHNVKERLSPLVIPRQ